MGKRILLSIIIIIFTANLSYSQLIPNLGGQRRGTSSLQFLKIGSGARATGMGESFVAVANDISALYWNPAGITQFSENGLTFSHSRWFVDTDVNFFGGVYHIGENSIGVSVTSLSTEDMKVTTEFQPQGTGEYFKFSDIALGVTYARQLTDQLSFGATVKYVHENRGELKMHGVLDDLGTYYKTGLGTARFAVVISNFGGQISPTGTIRKVDGTVISDWQRFPPPTLFRIGFAMEPWMTDNNKLTTSIQLNSPNDNAENVNLGFEYSFKNIFFFRGGYKINVDAENFSFGAGVNIPVSFAKANVDYSFANYRTLGIAQRLSVNLLFP